METHPEVPYSRQRIYEEDIAAVSEALCRPLITQGPEVEAFEAALAARVGARYAVAFSSGTAALMAATAALGLEKGSEGIVPSITFAASATSLIHAGIRPRIVDVDPHTGLIDLSACEEAIGASTSVIVAVHYAGFPLDMEALGNLARRHSLALIEDAAHALGAQRDGSPVGSCVHSDVAVFSFHPVKAITTGEGGALVTNDATIAETARRYRHHGIVPTPEVAPWSYDIRALGINGRITDFQCALGRSQLRHLDDHIAARNEIASAYDLELARIEGIRPAPRPPRGSVHAYHLYPALLDSEKSRRRAFDMLRAAGIRAQVHYVPLHRLTLFKEVGAPDPAEMRGAEEFYARELSLPIFPGLSVDDRNRVVEVLAQAAE